MKGGRRQGAREGGGELSDAQKMTYIASLASSSDGNKKMKLRNFEAKEQSKKILIYARLKDVSLRCRNSAQTEQ